METLTNISIIRFRLQPLSSRYAHFANITFDEELELYELLDLDADGELDTELDTTTQEVLLA
jgi:hypothetical protein